MKQLYKTVWEIPQKTMIKLALGRGPYICQSQSLNLYMTDPERSRMTMMHFFGWEKGLKTGQYYFRSRPARDAIKFTVDMEALHKVAESKDQDAMLGVLDKVGKPVEVMQGQSRNLGKKKAVPAGGFDEEMDASKLKRQKVKSCPLRRSDQPDDEECLACGS